MTNIAESGEILFIFVSLMKIFFIALMRYSRIPVPRLKSVSAQESDRALALFPLVGWVIGAICFLAYEAGLALGGTLLGVAFALAAGALATGCYHEDGWADVLDGFGGGRDRDSILAIMKDSRNGTFGTMGLILMTLLKGALLHSLLSASICADWRVALTVFILVHSLARMTSACLIFTADYVREGEAARGKPLEKRCGALQVAGVLFFGLLPLCAACLLFSPWCAAIPVPLALLLLAARHYFLRRIGGYTGDCLGALEQLGEALVLICMLAALAANNIPTL